MGLRCPFTPAHGSPSGSLTALHEPDIAILVSTCSKHDYCIAPINVNVNIYVHICVYVYIYMNMCIHVYMYICIYICMHIYICIHLFMYFRCIHVLYMRVCVCIYRYAFIYIYIHSRYIYPTLQRNPKLGRLRFAMYCSRAPTGPRPRQAALLWLCASAHRMLPWYEPSSSPKAPIIQKTMHKPKYQNPFEV